MTLRESVRALVAVCGLGAVAALALSGIGGEWAWAAPDRKRSETTTPAPSVKATNGRLFARKSFWNRRLAATTELDPSSSVLVQALAAEIQRERAAGIGPWIATNNGSTPLYRVGRAHPRVRVRLLRSYLHGGDALQRAFASVPIPHDAQPALGPDGHMTVWQPSTDSLWEFFGAVRDAGGWSTRWGGAIRRVSRSRGYYTPRAWRGATSNWGATATSLPVIGGTMLLAELERGRIDHALAINLPATRAGVFAWPAQRTDGVGPATTLPAGARLRLDPALNLSDLRLPKLTRMIARAVQRYGLVVRDQTGHAISLFGEDASRFPPGAYAPYYRGMTPDRLLAGFPWGRLQVLKMRLCSTAPCRRR